MRRITAIAALVCIAIAPGTSHAVGVRIAWQQQSGAQHFRLFISQPIDDDSKITEIDIDDPVIAEDGTFTTDVYGLNPIYPADFLMTSVTHGETSDASNMLSIAPESFCPILDDDHDGEVTVKDALAVARKAVGLVRGAGGSGDYLVTALETLRMAAAYICHK